MNIAAYFTVAKQPPLFVRKDRSANVLESILEPDVQLAVWYRPMPQLLYGIESLNWQIIRDIDEIIEGLKDASTVLSYLIQAGYPRGGLSEMLALEIYALATRFAALMQCSALRFRLDSTGTDGCPKFHMDYLTARLLMPLVGHGTEWIEIIAGSDTPIQQLQPGDVGVFKGLIWAAEPAILHRASPIALSGVPRLLLMLDPLDDVEWHRLAFEKAGGVPDLTAMPPPKGR